MSTPATRSTTTLVVNGEALELDLDHRTTLLDALREHLGLTGTKKGCDHGQCGSCTVLLDGRRVNACLTLAMSVRGRAVTTVEGVGTPEALHPVQEQFLACDAYQCGYCTPGQVVSAVAVLDEVAARRAERGHRRPDRAGRPRRGRGARADVGQPVPVRRLPRHRRRRARGRRGASA